MGLLNTVNKFEAKYFKDAITIEVRGFDNSVLQNQSNYQSYDLNGLFLWNKSQGGSNQDVQFGGSGIYDDSDARIIVNHQTLIDLGLASLDKCFINPETDSITVKGEPMIIDKVTPLVKYITQIPITYIFVSRKVKDI